MRLLTISALLIATCAIFLGVGQSEETAKIEDVKESPIENDLPDVEKEEKLLDSFERDEANNDKDEEDGKGDEDEDRGELPEEENKVEKEDENDETDSSSLSKNKVNGLEETSSDTEDSTTGSSKRWIFRRRRWRRFGRRFVRKVRRVARKIRRFGNRAVRKTTRFGNRLIRFGVRKTRRFGNRVIRFGSRVLGSAGKISNNVIGFGTGVVGGLGDKIANPFLDIMARKLKLIKKKFGKTCRLIKFSVGLQVKIPQLSWECFITEQKIALPPIKAADEENAGVQSDETMVHRFREDLSENDLAKIREFEAKEEVPQPRE